MLLYEAAEGPAPNFTPEVADYLINSTNGALESTIPGSPFPAGAGFVAGMAADHSGKFLYTADPFCCISEFTINGSTGVSA